MPRFRPDLPVQRPRPRPLTLPEAVAQVATELHHIAEALTPSPDSGSTGVTTDQFNAGIQTLMSKISEFADRLTAHNTRVETALAGLSGDVTALKAKIEELQNSPGGITPEDQALLDAIEAQIVSVAEKLEGLDNLTPPEVPPTP